MTITTPDSTVHHETVSIEGTDVTALTLPGVPECTGLRVPDVGPSHGRIECGPLSLDVTSLDEALAWRNAFQQLCSHFVVDNRRRAELAAHDGEVPA